MVSMNLDQGERQTVAWREFRRIVALAGLICFGGLTRPVAGSPIDEALGRLRSDDILIADAAVEELVQLGRPAADSLLPLLGDARRDVRAGALRGLGILRDPRAEAPIGRMLEASLAKSEPDTFDDRYFRILAIQALGRISGAGSIALLERAAESADPHERAQAAVALFRHDPKLGLPLIESTLADTTLSIRTLIVQGLGEAGHGEAKPHLLRATEDREWVVRDTAYRALATWAKDTDVLAVLEGGKKDPHWVVRATVLELLELPVPSSKGGP